MSSSVLQIAGEALIVSIVTVSFSLLLRLKSFQRIPKLVRTIGFGILYGVLACLATHYGVQYEDQVLNVRDLAPLSVGLFLDPTAGIIAGIIGGVERYIVGTYFNVGTFSRIACSVSTIVAGFIASLYHHNLLEGRKPSMFYSFAIGAITEVFHMLMLLVTHMNDEITTAFLIVSDVSVPMILCTAGGLVLISLLLGALSGKTPRIEKRENTPITQRFQRWLLVFVASTLVIAFLFTYTAQTKLTNESVQELMEVNAKDLETVLAEREVSLANAKEILVRQALTTARALATDITSFGGIEKISSYWVKKYAKYYDVFLVEVIDRNGIIKFSTDKSHVGFDMHSGEQSAEFLKLLKSPKLELVQDFQPISFDSSVSIMYVGVSMMDGIVQVGYDEEAIGKFADLAAIDSIASDRHIGKTGYVFILDDDGNILSEYHTFTQKTAQELGVELPPEPDTFFSAKIDGADTLCYYTIINGYRALLTQDADSVYDSRDVFAYETALMEILIFAVIFTVIVILVRNLILRDLNRINASLARITKGNLNETVDVHSSAEFSSLSRDINHTVDALKRYIAEAENRINDELEFAKNIQTSALPSVFPPFPDRKEFDLYAMMHTAKEVGGDFYDFFLVDPNHLALVIADVSGKGIPAALFMMKSKTIIKSLAESGKNPAEVLRLANETLCEGNSAEMFVTAWLGILDITTGIMTTANAGHEFPYIRRADGTFEVFKDKHGFVLGGMEGLRYKECTITFSPGDSLIVYTDGVTEATDAHSELFGMDRLESALNSEDDIVPEHVITRLKRAIDEFQGEAPQFDDITMLSFHYTGLPKPTVMQYAPTRETCQEATAFVEEYCGDHDVPMKDLMKILVAIDEITINIVSYSGCTGYTVSCLVHDNTATIQFSDDGKPYNPLDREDPDITLSAEERAIGGLGIFMVKKTMDDVEYSYIAGRNILTLKKNF